MDIKIVSIALSKKKGTVKKATDKATLVVDHGLKGDAHAGNWHRQISFLASENIDAERKKGLDVSFGDFAENIATTGVDWKTLPIGTRLKVGKSAIVEITQIGKICHNKCAIFYKSGDCIMPKEGVFARVLSGGDIKCGDTITLIESP